MVVLPPVHSTAPVYATNRARRFPIVTFLYECYFHPIPLHTPFVFCLQLELQVIIGPNTQGRC